MATTPLPHHYEIALTRTEGSNGVLSAGLRPEIIGGPPPEFGGQAGWWSPEHLLLASVSLCFMLTFLALAEKAQLKIDSYRCRTGGIIDKTINGVAFTRIVIGVELEASDRQRLEGMLQAAKKYCIVSNSLKTPLEIEILGVEAKSPA